jgi:host factor-I protein
MATELETGLPGIRMIQRLIRDAKEVELKLLTDDLLVGKILWQDNTYFCLVDHYNQQTLILRQVVAYIKPKA